MLRSTTIIAALCATTIACAPPVRRSGVVPSPAQLAELWIDPGLVPRDLFAGPSANGYVRPATDARLTVVKPDTGGFSITYRVHDERGREWRVKIGPEACERPRQLTDRRWRDAFRAGHYDDDIAVRYVARIRQKVEEGLELR